MAPKKNKGMMVTQGDATHYKYVAKAGMWCTTKMEKGNQTQSWSMEKPNGAA